MNSVERIFAVLDGKIPDRVPIAELWIDPKVFQSLYPGRSYYDFIEESGYYDAVNSLAGVVSPDIDWVDEKKKISRDKWGAHQQFTAEAIPFVVPPIRIDSETDLASYTPPDPANPAIINEVKEMVNRFKDKKALIFVGEDAFAAPQYLRGGLENLLIDFKLNPSLAERLAKMVTDYHIELYRRVIKEGIEIILLGDDYAGKTGPLVSPADFQRFILPGLTRIVAEIHKAGAYCIKHTDGNIWKIMDMLVGTGLDCLGPLQENAGVDLSQIKSRYPRVSVMGSINVDHLVRGSAEEVAKETKESIGRISPGGRYILSSSNTISSGVKPENLQAMIQTAREVGSYPL
ncbi:MAG: uroporphyrinogen decarboxylase family protein [Candidatus Omnitrophota bacterium]